MFYIIHKIKIGRKGIRLSNAKIRVNISVLSLELEEPSLAAQRWALATKPLLNQIPAIFPARCQGESIRGRNVIPPIRTELSQASAIHWDHLRNQNMSFRQIIRQRLSHIFVRAHAVIEQVICLAWPLVPIRWHYRHSASRLLRYEVIRSSLSSSSV